MTVKHPFQIVVVNKTGTHLFCSVKNRLYVFNLQNGKSVGSWVDTVDVAAKMKKQQLEKIKVLEEQAKENGQEEEGEEKEEGESSSKKLKDNNGKAVKIPKIPTPGAGAPPIYNYIRSLKISSNEKYLVGTTDSDKAVVIFELNLSTSTDNCLSLIKRQSFPKRPCAISIIDDCSLVVADKFGDVFQINIDNQEPIDEKLLVPILGHVSMLSDVLVAEHNKKKYILTGDRDEHIRVSNYPKAYVINNWLWGHREFVSNMHIPQWDSSILISGGGDEYLCIWKWFESKLLHKVQLREFIEPFLNDNHLPPERFLTEDSSKEISVSRIITLNNPTSSKKSLIVLVENTNAIIIFDIDGDFKTKHSQTFVTENPLIDICLDQTNSRLIASIDKEGDQDLLEFYSFDENNTLTHDGKNDIINTILDSNECDVESRKDFYPLYYINTLRKRSEH